MQNDPSSAHTERLDFPLMPPDDTTASVHYDMPGEGFRNLHLRVREERARRAEATEGEQLETEIPGEDVSDTDA